MLAKHRQQTFEDAVCSDLGFIAIQNLQLSRPGLNTDRPRFGTVTRVMMHRQPADRFASRPPPRLHGNVGVDDLAFREPQGQRYISGINEDRIGGLNDLLKFEDRAFDALLDEAGLGLEVDGDARRLCHYPHRRNFSGYPTVSVYGGIVVRVE